MSLEMRNNLSTQAEWDRPRVDMIGPARWRTRFTALAIATTVKPVFYGLTLWGRSINRRDPERLQRMSFAESDRMRKLSSAIKGTDIEAVQLPRCRAEWVTAANAGGLGDPTIVYFHGGAFIAGGLGSHRRMISNISRASGARVLSVDYRMLPQYRIADAIDDCLDAYRLVLSSGIDPNTVVLAGDSAGGFLAAMTALRIKEEGLPVPAGQALLCALTDSDMAPKRPPMRRHPDAMFPAATTEFIHDVFVSRNGTEPATASPVDSDLSGLGPFLQQVGSREMLRNDAVKLARRLDEDGVTNWLQIWDRAPHVFQFGSEFNPDARRAVEDIGSFTKSVVAAAIATRLPESNAG